MKQWQINLWYDFRRIMIYHTGIRKFFGKFVKPYKAYNIVTDITLEEIVKMKKDFDLQGVILDMDGTIKHYRKGVSEENREWVEILKKNLRVCILSNSNKYLVEEVAIPLELDYIYKARKPSEKGFVKAIDKLGLEKEKIIVIGDAFFGDIIGAKRIGLKILTVKDLNKYR